MYIILVHFCFQDLNAPTGHQEQPLTDKSVKLSSYCLRAITYPHAALHWLAFGLTLTWLITWARSTAVMQEHMCKAREMFAAATAYMSARP